MGKFLLLFYFSTGILMAYSTGDTLDKSVVEKLTLKKDTLYVIDFLHHGVTLVKKSCPWHRKCIMKK